MPLLTYTLHPRDEAEGALLWIKVASLTASALLVPLFQPRRYIPFNPEDPQLEINPEQICSWASLVVYSFVDPVISLGNRVSRMVPAQFPPLADYYLAANFVKKSYPYVDRFSGARDHHLFWQLMAIFWKEYIILIFLVIVHPLVLFGSPLAINRLLHYIETDGQDAVIRPGVWVAVLFLSPILGSIIFQFYAFVQTGNMVCCEGILTQLLFDHALRTRVIAEVVHTQGDVSQPSSTEGANAIQQGGKRLPQSGQQPATHNFASKLNTLLTMDIANVIEGRDFLFPLLYAPLYVVMSTVYLYYFLGWSTFVGLGVMIILLPLPGYIARKTKLIQKERMKKSDDRVQIVTEMVTMLRMIKQFSWEQNAHENIDEKRQEELRLIRKRKLIDLVNSSVSYIVSLAHMVATFATYTLIMKQPLSASLVFSTMPVFDWVRAQVVDFLSRVPSLVQGFISLERIQTFLREAILLDAVMPSATVRDNNLNTEQSNRIGFCDAGFTWARSTQDVNTSTDFQLRIEGELIFKQAAFNLVVGPTGSGKTSLLMALLGEMHYEPQSPTSWLSLPREGGIAYAAQESWIQNTTIKANILFGSAYHQERYQQVIYQCALERDLNLFEAGDETEVGEKGLTLSGGQKARITLARAVYSSANTLLLDDMLAALDVHTSKWIVEKCFKGNLMRGRTVLLVTHNLALTRPITQFVVALGGGIVRSQGSVADALAQDESLRHELADEEKRLGESDQQSALDVQEEVQSKKSAVTSGKLVAAEEVAEGHVGWPALMLYCRSFGGGQPLAFWAVLLFAFFAGELLATVQTWFLGYWANQYEVKNPASVNVGAYLGTYTALIGFAVLLRVAWSVLFLIGQVRASREIHNRLLDSVLGTTFRWLDITPTARIIARCTQDIRTVDGPISDGLSRLINRTLILATKLGAVILFTPVFVIPSLLMSAAGWYLGQIYIKAQLSVKREMSVAKAPILGHFRAAMAGIVSVRAYGAEEALKQESLSRINRYTRANRTFYNLNRWINIRMESIGALFVSTLAAYLTYGQSLSTAGDTGFSLAMAVGFSSVILWWVRQLNDFEIAGNSLERIKAYIDIDQEPKPSQHGVPPAHWPRSGELRVENLSARYSLNGPKVLHNVSFHITSGQRIGIVGRTGSGKSSLTLSLLRCILTEGEVYFDGIRTDLVNLDSLRSNITIIPQMPELLGGTLRRNLDPFSQHDDATLNIALCASGLNSLQTADVNAKIDLDSPIASGGGNLSVGQRQIIALARAIVRQSKLLILDEATSAIDYETDNVIQTSLRQELKRDVTVITVAHRLQTIMDADKIMVLDEGRIVEFDHPFSLLQRENGFLRSLVDESGDKEKLYAMAKPINSG